MLRSPVRFRFRSSLSHFGLGFPLLGVIPLSSRVVPRIAPSTTPAISMSGPTVIVGMHPVSHSITHKVDLHGCAEGDVGEAGKARVTPPCRRGRSGLNRHNAASRSASAHAGRLSVGGSLCGRSAMVRAPREITDGSLYHKDGTIFFSMKVALTRLRQYLRRCGGSNLTKSIT